MPDKFVVDVVANRRAQKWSRKELVGRILWSIVHPLFMWSPRPLWGWRRMLLRAFGATIGQEVHIYPSVIIAIPWNLSIGNHSAVGDGAILYCLGKIAVADRVTISQGAHLCAGTHDFRDISMPLLRPPIAIESDTWICADAFVGPGVRIGSRAVVGARAVVTKDVGASTIVAGNPARVIGLR